MSLRPFRLPADLSLMIDLLPPSFQYPENPAWSLQDDELQSLLGLVSTARRLWPLISAMQRFTPALRDVLHGFIWEEYSRPVGLVNISRDGSGDDWVISNVGVLPEYRRRGIARKLVEAAIGLARARRGARLRLDVIAGNDPAYELYASLGFAHFATSTALQHDPPSFVANPPPPDGYAATPTPPMRWRPFFELAQRSTPPEVEAYQPVTIERFRVPASMRAMARLINSMSGVRTRGVVVREAGGSGRQIVATTKIEAHARGGGLNACTMMIDPGHGQVAPYLVGTTLHAFAQLSPRNRIECHIPNWQPALIEAARANGFSRQYESYSMGMQLNG
jgi:GNAT superfamily N-acetyltransferase